MVDGVVQDISTNYLEKIKESKYVYYLENKQTLVIDTSMKDSILKVNIAKFYKTYISKEQTFESRMVGKMTKEQIKEYILDTVRIFIKQ